MYLDDGVVAISSLEAVTNTSSTVQTNIAAGRISCKHREVSIESHPEFDLVRI